MNNYSRTLQSLIWGGLALVILAISVLFVRSRLVAPGRPLPVISQVSDFTLTNSLGQTVTLADLRGQVWVADIIFTRCAGPCPHMTQQMSELQSALPKDSPVKLVTLTTDPEFDTPAIMKQYGERFGARPDRWLLLTGAKSEIARLAIDGLKLSAVEKKAEERQTEVDLFIHTTIFVVVDKHGRLRGGFETTEPGYEQPILDAVNRLLRER